jgi:hypothetical protein
MIRMASSSGRSVAFTMGRRTAVTVASSSSSSSSRNALLAAGGVAVLAASVVSNTKYFLLWRTASTYEGSVNTHSPLVVFFLRANILLACCRIVGPCHETVLTFVYGRRRYHTTRIQ